MLVFMIHSHINSNNKNLKGKEQKITGTVSGDFRWSPIYVGNTNIVAPRIFVVDYFLKLADYVVKTLKGCFFF